MIAFVIVETIVWIVITLAAVFYVVINIIAIAGAIGALVSS